jgi:hypothetical protein
LRLLLLSAIERWKSVRLLELALGSRERPQVSKRIDDLRVRSGPIVIAADLPLSPLTRFILHEANLDARSRADGALQVGIHIIDHELEAWSLTFLVIRVRIPAWSDVQHHAAETQLPAGVCKLGGLMDVEGPAVEIHGVRDIGFYFDANIENDGSSGRHGIQGLR